MMLIMKISKFFKRLYSQKSRWTPQLMSLPYKISLDNAKSKFTEVGFFEHTNKNINSPELEVFTGDTVTENYIPFHSADITNLQTSFTGEYGIERFTTSYIWNGKTMTPINTIITDWYDVTGVMKKTDYPLGTVETQIYAGFKYPTVHIHQALKTCEVFKIKPLTPEQKDKKKVEPHEMKIKFYVEKLISSVLDLELQRAENYVKKKYNADSTKLTVSSYFDEATIELYSYHIPAYVYTFGNTGQKYHKFINGYDGTLSGQKIYSTKKMGIVGAIGGMATAITIVGIFIPHLKPIAIAVRVLTCGVVGASIFGGYAYNYHKYKYKNFTSQSDADIDNNKKFEETADDATLRKLPETNGDSNGNNKNESRQEKIYTDGRNDRFPKEKLDLLGIKKDDVITLEYVKQCYYREIKKWHPDVYHKDPEFGKLMSQRIMEANKYITISFW